MSSTPSTANLEWLGEFLASGSPINNEEKMGGTSLMHFISDLKMGYCFKLNYLKGLKILKIIRFFQ